MGSEMAYNLFSKQFAAAPDSRFVVCDAVPSAAHRFCNQFSKEFPRSQLVIAESPEL